jgi:hypothetical protein
MALPHSRPALAWIALLVVALLAPLHAGCGKELKSTSLGRGRPPVAELWQEPADLERRNLYYGPGGQRLAPRPGTRFRFVARDTSGNSPGYDVTAPGGREWDVKIGEEAQVEVVASRVLWAIGYHQPPTYFVTNWQLVGAGSDDAAEPGRFRLEALHETVGEWSWHENPFVGLRAFRGLVAANLLLNNWDLKASQNRIYRVNGSRPATRFVVQDLGAALGKTRFITFGVGTRNDIDDFEGQQYVKGVEHGRVLFDYHGRHRELLQDITPADVVWVCRLLDRITDRQWDDAFRAAGYDGAVRARFIRKIEAKIDQGLALSQGAN